MSFPGHVFTRVVAHSDDEDRCLPEAFGSVRVLVTAPVDYPGVSMAKFEDSREGTLILLPYDGLSYSKAI